MDENDIDSKDLFDQEKVLNMLSARYQSEIADLRNELEEETSILVKLGKILNDSRQILEITEKSEPAGFLESLHLFSVKSSQEVTNQNLDSAQESNPQKGIFCVLKY